MFNNGDCCADGHVAKELEIMIRDNPSSGQPYHSSTYSTNRSIDSIQFDQTGMECEWLSMLSADCGLNSLLLVDVA